MTSADLLDDLAKGIVAATELVPGIGPELHDALAEIMPLLLVWLDRKLDGGKPYKAPLYALFLSEADSAADEAEKAKFGS